MEDSFLNVEQLINDLLLLHKDISCIYMSFKTFTKLRQQSSSFLSRFDFVTDRPTLEKGLYATLDKTISIRINNKLLFSVLSYDVKEKESTKEVKYYKYRFYGK